MRIPNPAATLLQQIEADAGLQLHNHDNGIAECHDIGPPPKGLDLLVNIPLLC
jgi:hypothetical protein